MSRCYRCGGESRRPAGEPCQFRDDVGHPCGGRLIEPETMTCTRCGADVEVTTNTAEVLPWVEIHHTGCGGRLATKVGEECAGCTTGGDLGFAEYENTIAYVFPGCPLHDLGETS